jgi:hypothetical protein
LSTTLRFAASGFFLLWQTGPLLAHTSSPGLGGFYLGLMHSVSTPGSLLALVAFGLLLAQQGHDPRALWKIYGVASVASLVAAFGIAATFTTDPWFLFAALLIGLGVASGLQFPIAVLRGSAVFAGLLLGVASEPDPGPLAAMQFTAAGAIVGANLAVGYIIFALTELQMRVTWAWIPIGVRVVASWIAAVSMLLLALVFRTTSP